MSDRCPYCGSTDVADMMDERKTCLDCDGVWKPGGRRSRRWRSKKK